VWSRQGGELYYVQDNTLWAASVERQPALRVGAARPIVSGEALHATLSDPSNYRQRFDVAVDGKRFVVIRNLSARTYAVSVVQNWAKAHGGSR
jgi:hypothetical protein